VRSQRFTLNVLDDPNWVEWSSHFVVIKMRDDFLNETQDTINFTVTPLLIPVDTTDAPYLSIYSNDSTQRLVLRNLDSTIAVIIEIPQSSSPIIINTDSTSSLDSLFFKLNRVVDSTLPGFTDTTLGSFATILNIEGLQEFLIGTISGGFIGDSVIIEIPYDTAGLMGVSSEKLILFTLDENASPAMWKVAGLPLKEDTVGRARFMIPHFSYFRLALDTVGPQTSLSYLAGSSHLNLNNAGVIDSLRFIMTDNSLSKLSSIQLTSKFTNVYKSLASGSDYVVNGDTITVYIAQEDYTLTKINNTFDRSGLLFKIDVTDIANNPGAIPKRPSFQFWNVSYFSAKMSLSEI